MPQCLSMGRTNPQICLFQLRDLFRFRFRFISVVARRLKITSLNPGLIHGFLGPTESAHGICIGYAVFVGLTNMTNGRRQGQGDWLRYSVCSSSPRLMQCMHARRHNILLVYQKISQEFFFLQQHTEIRRRKLFEVGRADVVGVNTSSPWTGSEENTAPPQICFWILKPENGILRCILMHNFKVPWSSRSAWRRTGFNPCKIFLTF